MDMLAAIGGLLGALGGPAGLWAAWNQRQDSRNREKRERLVKLRDCVLKLRRIGSEAAQQYRDDAWWNSSGGLEARNTIVELRPYIQQEWPTLEAGLLEVTWSYDAASVAVITPATPLEEQSSVRRDQSRHGDLLTQQANDIAVKIHNL